MPDVLKPAPLKRRATIGIISPASPPRNEDYLQRGVQYVESLGYRVKLGKHAMRSFNGYLAGTDEQRVEDIEAMFANPKIDAIFCGRGGYGCSRILHKLNYDLIAANPKILVGFSDITALQSAIFRKTGLVTFSGPMPSVDMRDEFDAFAEETFWRMLTATDPVGVVSQPEEIVSLRSGSARGRLLCGTLSIFASLCGTPFAPSVRKAIYLLEDIGEEPYRIDRLLSQLENAGVFAKASGIAFGQFTGIPTTITTPQPPVSAVVQEYVERLGLPALGNLLFGHQAKKLTLPFGVMARINGTTGALELLEAGTEAR